MRLIDADELLKRRYESNMWNSAEKQFNLQVVNVCDIKNAPTVDAQRVKHGKREDEIKNDSVHHPSHYTQGKIECIDFILDKKLDFSLGNAVKYIVRAGHKKSADKTDLEKQIEDLRKARQYLDFEIEHLEGKR